MASLGSEKLDAQTPKNDGSPLQKKTFRGDIEGMRALAVLLVLIAHIKFGMSSGFIGVDIFFVISGYLITQQLFTLITKERPLLNFYKRRILRILPAALSVIIFTLIASYFLLSPLRFEGYLKDGLASALSYINYRLAYKSVNYFASGSSPFQHYWSLAVEEQFYLLWPLCVILISKIAVDPGKLKRNLLVFLIIAFSMSLYASFTLTATEPFFAYFSMHTRAWQLASGCFLAIITATEISFQKYFLILCAWIGIILLVCALVFISPDTPYPGVFALLPTFSAFFLILAGSQGEKSVISKALSHPLPQYIGKISYSLYLVHWPIIIIFLYNFYELTVFHKVSILFLSFLSAMILYEFVENPIRRNPQLLKNPARTFTLGATCMIATALTISSLILSEYVYRNYFFHVKEQLPIKSLARLQESIAESIKTKNLSEDAYKSIYRETKLRDDVGDGHTSPKIDHCILLIDSADINSPRSCVFENGSSKKTIALIGDSHAYQWTEVLANYALRSGFKLMTFTKVGCPITDQKVVKYNSKTEYEECYLWRDKLIKELEKIKPDVIIYQSIAYRNDTPDSFKRLIDKLLLITPNLIKIVDTPNLLKIVDASYPEGEVVDCLVHNSDDISICQLRYSLTDQEKQEIDYLKEKNVQVIEPQKWFCKDDICPAIIDDQLVFRDNSHVSWGYINYIAELFITELNLK